jgi:hypothetical protein
MGSARSTPRFPGTSNGFLVFNKIHPGFWDSPKYRRAAMWLVEVLMLAK